jgi:hypothetical protein
MRKTLLTSAIFGVGLATTVVSATAKADDWHRYRWEDRRTDVYRHVERRAYVQDVAMWDVPGRVRDRVNEYRDGRRIARAQLIRQNGGVEYYRFRIRNGRRGDFYLDITPYGRVLGRTNVW